VLLAEIVCGIGIGLLNGTHSALLFDSLLSLDRAAEYRKLEGKRQAVGLYGVACAGLASGFLYDINHFLPIYLTMAMQLMALGIACVMREPERHKSLSKKHPVVDIVETIKFVVHGHAEIGIVVVSAAALFSVTKILMWSQQPYYLALNLPKHLFGILMSGGWLLGGLSSHMAYRLDGKISVFRALALAWGLALIVCIGTGAYLGYQGIGLLMIGGTCIYGTVSPRINEALNRSIGSERRATALSTVTLLSSALFICVSSVVGWVSDRWSIQAGLLALAAWLLVTGGGLVWLKELRLRDRAAG
jgi:hypothetical protein